MENKVVTYTMDAGNQPLTVTSIDALFDALRLELEYQEPNEDGEDNAVQIIITVGRTMTQQEVDNLPEWEG